MHSVKGKKILVTGGTGFIGSALVKGLLRAGAQVRSFDNDSRGSRSKLGDAADHVELVVGDMRDPSAVRSAVSGVDSVCHLAYINGTEYFYTKPELILEVAVKGMMNVIDACISENVKELVLASSSEVYQTPPVVPTDETVPLVVPDVLNPRYSYGGGKIICELLLVNYGRKHFDRALIFRPHNVYGPDMGREHVIPQFVLRMKELAAKQPEGTLDFPIQGTGEETRSFIFIDDFVAGLIQVMERGEHMNIYHIGSGWEHSVRELALETGACFGRSIRVVAGELLKGSTLRRCPDISKLKALGFEPATTLKDGLAKTACWYVENCK